MELELKIEEQITKAIDNDDEELAMVLHECRNELNKAYTVVGGLVVGGSLLIGGIGIMSLVFKK